MKPLLFTISIGLFILLNQNLYSQVGINTDGSSIKLSGQKSPELPFYPLHALQNAISRLNNSDSLYFTFQEFSKIEYKLKKRKKTEVLLLYTAMVCPICNGFKRVRTDMQNNCSICCNTGKVQRWVDASGNQYLFQPSNIRVREQLVTCKACDGKSGTIYRDVEQSCPFCLGQGTIYVIDKGLKIRK